MREIKFRAWDKNNKKILSVFSFDMNGAVETKEGTHQVGTTELMQFTGLKDKNGKEIYEGDIVQIQHPCWTETTQVKFFEGTFFCEQLKKHPKNESKSCPSFRDISRSNWKLEVIGNIYKNPELLK